MPHQLRPTRELPGDNPHIHALAMFVVSEAQAAAIRAIFHQRGELSAATLLCDRTRALCLVFPGYMRRWPIDVKRLAERGTALLTCRQSWGDSLLK